MLDLLDYRRQVSDLYHHIRQTTTTPDATATQIRAACDDWRSTRDRLFATHLMSALDASQKAGFTGLDYFEYDPAWRVRAVVQPLARDGSARTFQVDVGDDGAVHYTCFGTVDVALPGGSGTLDVYWIDGYGGGVFLPFRDGTSGDATYGAGRYLLDTIKGADLGQSGDGALWLDFNFAYNPSCSYNRRWVCPLAPPPNWLDFPVTAGERYTER